MIKIDVILDNISWKKYLKNPKNYFKNKAYRLNKKTKLYKKNHLVFTLMLSKTTRIKQLNKKFRKKNKSTDVLSFPFYNKVDLLKLLKVKNKRKNKSKNTFPIIGLPNFLDLRNNLKKIMMITISEQLIIILKLTVKL